MKYKLILLEKDEEGEFEDAKYINKKYIDTGCKYTIWDDWCHGNPYIFSLQEISKSKELCLNTFSDPEQEFILEVIE